MPQNLPKSLGFKPKVGQLNAADVVVSAPTNFPAPSPAWVRADLQRGDFWCWAAVASAFLEAYVGEQIEQCEVVRQYAEDNWSIAGNPCPFNEAFDQEGTVSDAVNAVSDIVLDPKNRDAYPDLREWLDYQLGLSPPRAVPVLIRFPSLNHCICVFGRAGENSYYVFDPAEGVVICEFGDFDDYDESGTDGKWFHFYSWNS
jgi:hypothetical protein